MEKTPVSKSKFSYTTKKKEIQDANIPAGTENEESPLQIACTQETCENIDVVWDWNSPQAKHRPRKSQKRLILSQSPKISMKRHPSNNSIQDFEKLRQELKSLREEIAVPENEDCLRLSPVEEAEYKNTDANNDNMNRFYGENILNQDFDDFFNNSIDEQLLLFSDKIDDLNHNGSKLFLNVSEQGKLLDSSNLNVKVQSSTSDKQVNFKQANKSNDIILNDSFDNFLQDFDAEQTINTEKNTIKPSLYRTESNNHNSHNITGGRVEFCRTESFEMSNLENSTVVLTKEKLDEIKRKRLEALAKLESKRKQETTVTSPIQCSSKEIELKRQQALAKREAKRQQEIIERKRQEALKRLEISRKKNVKMIKSSLTNRLNN